MSNQVAAEKGSSYQSLRTRLFERNKVKTFSKIRSPTEVSPESKILLDPGSLSFINEIRNRSFNTISETVAVASPQRFNLIKEKA